MAADSKDEGLNERAQRLLRVLVQSYIRDGAPVGSRTLSRDSGLALEFRNRPQRHGGPRAARLRDLAAYLGRARTDRQGLSLLRRQPHAGRAADRRIRPRGDPPPARPALPTASKALVASASQLLSNITHLAGVVTLPLAQSAGADADRVPRRCRRTGCWWCWCSMTARCRTASSSSSVTIRREELRRAANFLNEHFAGRTLAQIHQEMIQQLKDTHEHLNQEMLDGIAMAQSLFSQSGPTRGHRVRDRRGDQPDGVRRSSAMSRSCAGCSRRSTRNATSCSCSTRACAPTACRSSSARNPATRSSMTTVSSRRPYSSDQGVVGVLGVIGPTRMAYERIIPIVDLTAKLLGAALNSRR